MYVRMFVCMFVCLYVCMYGVISVIITYLRTYLYICTVLMLCNDIHNLSKAISPSLVCMSVRTVPM